MLLVWLLAVGMLAATSYDIYGIARAYRFNEAIRSGDPLEGDSARARFTRAYALHQQWDFQEAIKAYVRAGEDAGPDLRATIKFNLANLYLQYAASLGDASDLSIPLIELAKEDYRELLRADSQHWDAKYNLELALVLLPDPEEVDPGEEMMPEHSRRALAPMDVEEQLP